jgi:hypothetical protein
MGKSQSLKDLEISSDPIVSSRGAPPPQYLDLDRLRNADGIIAIISQRLANRAITFALFKEFERDNRVERTSFIASTLRESYVSMVGLVFERIEKLHTDTRLMEQLQRDAIAKLDPASGEHAARILNLRPVKAAGAAR